MNAIRLITSRNYFTISINVIEKDDLPQINSYQLFTGVSIQVLLVLQDIPQPSHRLINVSKEESAGTKGKIREAGAYVLLLPL